MKTAFAPALFLLALFPLYLHYSSPENAGRSFALMQTEKDSSKQQDRHLRAKVHLDDTMSLACECQVRSTDVAYTFTLLALALGQCSSSKLVICIPKDVFEMERSRWGGKRTEFYWVLYKTPQQHNGLPVYRYTGNF